jgi:hypothetical protein
MSRPDGALAPRDNAQPAGCEGRPGGLRARWQADRHGTEISAPQPRSLHGGSRQNRHIYQASMGFCPVSRQIEQTFHRLTEYLNHSSHNPCFQPVKTP